jgi:aquaporin related protein
VNAWVFFRVSGGLFNPAVTLGMALIGAIGWIRATLLFIAQILGSLAASGVVDGLFPGELSVSTTLAGGTTIVQGLCEYPPCHDARTLLTLNPVSH